jgi:hypothetical protein
MCQSLIKKSTQTSRVSRDEDFFLFFCYNAPTKQEILDLKGKKAHKLQGYLANKQAILKFDIMRSQIG